MSFIKQGYFITIMIVMLRENCQFFSVNNTICKQHVSQLVKYIGELLRILGHAGGNIC